MRIYHKSITKECQKPTLMKICNVILRIKHITTSKVTDILELKKDLLSRKDRPTSCTVSSYPKSSKFRLPPWINSICKGKMSYCIPVCIVVGAI